MTTTPQPVATSNRAIDRSVAVRAVPAADLPPVPWGAIGQRAPLPLQIDAREPEDPLPRADIVILTWTSAEWFALDHVFFNSGAPRNPQRDTTWREGWHAYTRASEGFTADAKSGQLWGSFRLAQITDRSGRPWRVLLFKSNSHLAHPPWIAGLSAMLRAILQDTNADRIYTIGTAGGARLDERLGDVIVTNAAKLDLQRPQNAGDPDNGAMFRCPSWFPSDAIANDVEGSLLFPMKDLVTQEALGNLFKALQEKHPDDPGVASLTLADLVNDAIRPESLGEPRIRAMKDVPLLTTDYYYISGGDGDDAYSFLEMDDAVIAREANRAGVRFACVRNVSDPVVPAVTARGRPISAAVRADWSGLIYTTYGLHTSYNGALGTWAAIAGDGLGAYNPPRGTKSPSADDPLEVKLVYEVRSCGACDFFWPGPDAKQPAQLRQPYGPYTAFDFDVDVPYAAAPSKGSGPFPWLRGRTRPPAFPNGEIADGCRKAPIMTIGINPNMTAFSPGQTGAAWAYPSFSSDEGTDAWTKYAWYYRYRTVFQERLKLDFVKRFVLAEGKIIAPRAGQVVSAQRASNAPAWTFKVRYDGDATDTQLDVPGKVGEFPYVLLFDAFPPNNRFAAGDVLAGRLAVPPGIQAEVFQQAQTYYQQFEPTLALLDAKLRATGYQGPALRIGEDVSQLDMVACASPHWNENFLGGSQESIDRIVQNCVVDHAWAMKQLVHTRPAILYVVSQSSWKMFAGAFGAHIQRKTPLPERPDDADFTLLRATTDPTDPCYLVLETTVAGRTYKLQTRIVITPHFSYGTNFLPQYRVSQADWKTLQTTQPDLVKALTPENGFTLVAPDPKYKGGHYAVQLSVDPAKAAASQAFLKEHFPKGYSALQKGFYDAHAMMASVLDGMVDVGALSVARRADGSQYLARTEGSCRFCVNEHWQFPGECSYGNAREAPPPTGFLEAVADWAVKNGRESQ